MFLGEDGKYYLDEDQNVEITSDLIYQLYKRIPFNLVSINPVSFIYNVAQRNYNFLYKNNTFFYIDENKVEHALKIKSVKIIFRVEGIDHERHIFTYKQFEKNLKKFKISFPWSDNIIVTKDIINEKINDSDKSSLIIIENIDFESLIRPEIIEIKKFQDLSVFISYYLKSEVNIEKYEENNFLDKNIFNIDPAEKIELFFQTERSQFLDEILDEFKKGVKEYFFTGLHSIGKTFTLLAFNVKENPLRKKAYFNLETFRKKKNFFEVIIYESQNLFENKDKWKEAFILLKSLINDSKNFLLIILNLIKLLIKCYIIEGIEYIIILDQIKFESLEDNEYKLINLIRNVIQKNKNFYLIGCCSINYKGVKEILFYNWNNKTIQSNNKKNIPKLKYIRSSKIEDINNSNKYLQLLGNMPRFKNIHDKLNSKIVNLFIKKTKEKFLKFYGAKKFYEFENIENIPVLKKFEQKMDFLDKLKMIPFKYFEIYEEQNMFDFSCPIIKRSIEEILEENELNKKAFDFINDINQLGWYFEKRVIYAIRITNLIPKIIYIDNSYLIPTIFLPYKVEGLLLKENSLFYFDYCNVRRYDCAVYLGNEKALLLIQISIKKSKNKLDQYNSKNFETDLDDMQRFLNINGIKVKKYYLLFILLYTNYKTSKDLKTFRDKYFSYILYNIDDKKFIGKIEKMNDLYEIKIPINSGNNINLSIDYKEFGKINDSFDFEYKGKYHKYYAEKGMSLEKFFNEIFGEEVKEEFVINTGVDLSSYHLKSFKSNFYNEFFEENHINILLLNYQEGDILYGMGDSKNNFNWYSYNIITRELKRLKSKNYSDMNCFLFKTIVKINIADKYYKKSRRK